MSPALFAMQGGHIRTVRAGRWKLHGGPTPRMPRRGDDWVDPRAPDGKPIIAPDEQSRPSEFPGVKTGDESQVPALFNLATDPAEQHNVADENPDVVARLTELLEEMRRQQQALAGGG